MEYKKSIKYVSRLIKELRKDNPKGRFRIVGSIRRKCPINKDIDILTNIPLNKLKVKNHKVDIARGVRKWTYKDNNDQKIDIFYSEDEYWYSALLHFTGGKIENIKLRIRAKEKGYKLNQYGLTNIKTKKVVSINSEKDIYKFLGKPYRSPSQRD